MRRKNLSNYRFALANLVKFCIDINIHALTYIFTYKLKSSKLPAKVMTKNYFFQHFPKQFSIFLNGDVESIDQFQTQAKFDPRIHLTSK